MLRIVDADGETVCEYQYDPYGNILSKTATDVWIEISDAENDSTNIFEDLNDLLEDMENIDIPVDGEILELSVDLGEINPLRYRGYYYDTETELYYLQSRYYDPVVGRFINADEYTSTGQGIIGNNMFAYCGNNPANREDSNGELWQNVVFGVLTQYATDVIGNIAAGASGFDILIPTSSLAEYTAVAVSSLIPGNSLISAGIRSLISISIPWADNVLRGESEKNSFKEAGKAFLFNTVLDFYTGRLFEATWDKMGTKDYSVNVPQMVQNSPGLSLKNAYEKLQVSNSIGRGVGKVGRKLSEITITRLIA